MSNYNLDKSQKEFLRMCNRFGKIQGLQNVRDLFGGRSETQEGIGELEDLGFVEREAYGVWSLTDKAFEVLVREVRCEDCGGTPEQCMKNYSCDSTRGNYSVVLHEFL